MYVSWIHTDADADADADADTDANTDTHLPALPIVSESRDDVCVHVLLREPLLLHTSAYVSIRQHRCACACVA